MEHDDSTLGDLESTLKSNARDLVDSLEQGNFGAAVQLINELNKVRDRGLYHEVGKLTVNCTTPLSIFSSIRVCRMPRNCRRSPTLPNA
ncbi:hypothetical protein SAMN05216280_102134 [Ectopseudomonas oleovorans]|nr:hypothetical protein SAMN05216280_102134 [Pseudomonas oleovorans]